MSIAGEGDLGKGPGDVVFMSTDGLKEAKGTGILSRIPDGALIALLIILAGAGGFGLGMLFDREQGSGTPIGITGLAAAVAPLVDTAAATSVIPAPSQAKSGASVSPKTSQPPEPPAPAPLTSGQYVASKNGTKYYLPSCGSVKNIKEENKVWFATKADAEAAGYTPAATCKGL